MDEGNGHQPTDESLRKAMDFAWRDHHHARDQTWKTVQMVAVLGAGLLSIDFAYESLLATAFAAVLVILASAFGVGTTWNHRKLEVLKFIHLMNCEKLLGLHRDDIIPLYTDEESMKKKDERVRDGAVKVPTKFQLIDTVNPKRHSTALFILRIHLLIMAFAWLVLIMRWRAF